MQIHTVDCHYIYPHFAASFLLVDKDRACFVEANTSHAVPHLLSALRQTGLSPEQVDQVIVTHAHLDHAAGTSALLAACPNARLATHPKAARHLIDPSRLVASARGVYGAEFFDRLYGNIDPIPAERVDAMEDGARLKWGSGEFEFLHTLGHASHHVCVRELSSGSIFTGDSFGVCYPELQKDGLFILASTSPTDFDPPRAIETVRRIRDLRPAQVFLTHFGKLTAVDEAASALEHDLEFSAALLSEVTEALREGRVQESAAYGFCRERIEKHFARVLGARWERPRFRELLETDIDVNAQGVVFSAKRRLASDKRVGAPHNA